MGGSLATLLYTDLRLGDQPKEYAEIYSNSKVLVIDDFGPLQVYGQPIISWRPKRKFKQFVRITVDADLALLSDSQIKKRYKGN